ncbi:hypothetical protein I3679_004545 [Proteus mirabilis]|uniref:Uncharacterized protein n=1 Tax=Proteus mirabilis TaxID=584 RepID=A0ABD5LR41_PROMI
MDVSEQFEVQEIVAVEGSSLQLSVLEPQPEKLTQALSEFLVNISLFVVHLLLMLWSKVMMSHFI